MSFDDVRESICMQLRSALTELTEGDGEVRDKVMELFRREDLPGIERLMRERRREERLIADVKAFLDRWSSNANGSSDLESTAYGRTS